MSCSLVTPLSSSAASSSLSSHMVSKSCTTLSEGIVLLRTDMMPMNLGSEITLDVAAPLQMVSNVCRSSLLWPIRQLLCTASQQRSQSRRYLLSSFGSFTLRLFNSFSTHFSACCLLYPCALSILSTGSRACSYPTHITPLSSSGLNPTLKRLDICRKSLRASGGTRTSMHAKSLNTRLLAFLTRWALTDLTSEHTCPSASCTEPYLLRYSVYTNPPKSSIIPPPSDTPSTFADSNPNSSTPLSLESDK
mmetsp:Transcript_8219/g.20070  ORF Transcript_8219/g.20070 Transcript_8219/m.20070 type:complete len:249 (-) Transcript_8219:913-1659(-)